MTSGDDSIPPTALTRRSAREAAARTPLRRPAPVTAPSARPARWSRRRGVLGVFAGIAALGFAAAYVGPAAFALTDSSTDAGAATLYASTVDDAQTFISADAADIDLDRGGYTTWVKPKPKPTPTPTPKEDVLGTLAQTRPFYTGGGAPAEWMAAAGIAESDWGFVDYIVGRESGWNPNATNRSSGACGLVQALPCSKVPGNGYDPVDNLRWANGYATGRYGSWGGAYAFWTSNHWW